MDHIDYQINDCVYITTYEGGSDQVISYGIITKITKSGLTPHNIYYSVKCLDGETIRRVRSGLISKQFSEANKKLK